MTILVKYIELNIYAIYDVCINGNSVPFVIQEETTLLQIPVFLPGWSKHFFNAASRIVQAEVTISDG